MTRTTVVAALCLLALLVTPVAFSQTVTGTINGTVTDKSGAALPGVTITARNVETGLERILVTNERGFFNAPFLPLGKYSVSAELEGFGAIRHENIRVDLNNTSVQDFILGPSTLSETVTVSADAPRINVTDGEVKQTLRSEEIMLMPNPVADATASFLRLATVFSGFQENPSSGQNNPTASGGSSVNFNGAGTRGTTFQINGVNNDDSSENQHRQGVTLSSIKSFQILTNSFSAEFGRSYGAVVLIQTKSGTNNIDGELDASFMDASFNENDIFNKNAPKPNSYRRNYSLTSGFPILRDKLFFFGSAESVQNAGFTCCTYRGYFTPADLALPRLTLGNDTPENRAWQNAILARFPTSNTGTGPGGAQILPAPESGARAYKYIAERSWPDRDYSGRLDWNITNNNTVNGRYQTSHQIRHNNEPTVGETTEQNNRESNVGITWTGVLTSNTVQEGRLGLGLRSTNVNILAGNDTPIIRINNSELLQGSFTLLGNSGLYPINRHQRDKQFVYNISTTRWNRHTLRSGLDIRTGQLNDRADSNSRGVWTFSSTCAGQNFGTGVAAFMAGCVASYSDAYGPIDLRNKTAEQNAYVQDDWRPTDGLTFNIGARYERVEVPKEDNNRIDYMYKTSDYLDPRLGFAYQPNWEKNRFLRAVTGGNGQFSIRGGFGIYHGRVFQSAFSQNGASVRFNPPNALSLSLGGVFGGTGNTYSNFNISDPTGGYTFTPGTVPTTRYSITTINPNLKMPEARQWNLTFERQIFSSSRIRASYIGMIGKGLVQLNYWNLPVSPLKDPSSPYVIAADPLCAGTGTTGVPITATCPKAVPIAANEISARVPRSNERRPDARYTTNLNVSNSANSWYHAGQLEWESGYFHGFNGRASYTFSKAIDEGSELTATGTGDINIFPDDEQFRRGLSRFDTRHRFTFLGSYELPFFKNAPDGFLKTALGGWQLSTVVRAATGTPFTIVDSGAIDFDFDGITAARPIALDPKYSGGWHVDYPGTSQSEMPKGAFRRATYGDKMSDLVARNSYYTDGSESIDLGISKSFAISHGMTLMFRVDAFNLFDHTTWGFPINNFNDVNFGKLTALNYSPRTMQAGFRLLY